MCGALIISGASPTQENVKGSTAIDLAKTETTLTLLCPLHYSAARGMLDNLVAEVAKVPRRFVWFHLFPLEGS